MMLLQQILCLATLAQNVRSMQGSYSHLLTPSTFQEMVYDEDLRCARIVRRRRLLVLSQKETDDIREPYLDKAYLNKSVLEHTYSETAGTHPKSEGAYYTHVDSIAWLKTYFKDKGEIKAFETALEKMQLRSQSLSSIYCQRFEEFDTSIGRRQCNGDKGLHAKKRGCVYKGTMLNGLPHGEGTMYCSGYRGTQWMKCPNNKDTYFTENHSKSTQKCNEGICGGIHKGMYYGDRECPKCQGCGWIKIEDEVPFQVDERVGKRKGIAWDAKRWFLGIPVTKKEFEEYTKKYEAQIRPYNVRKTVNDFNEAREPESEQLPYYYYDLEEEPREIKREEEAENAQAAPGMCTGVWSSVCNAGSAMVEKVAECKNTIIDKLGEFGLAAFAMLS